MLRCPAQASRQKEPWPGLLAPKGDHLTVFGGTCPDTTPLRERERRGAPFNDLLLNVGDDVDDHVRGDEAGVDRDFSGIGAAHTKTDGKGVRPGPVRAVVHGRGTGVRVEGGPRRENGKEALAGVAGDGHVADDADRIVGDAVGAGEWAPGGRRVRGARPGGSPRAVARVDDAGRLEEVVGAVGRVDAGGVEPPPSRGAGTRGARCPEDAVRVTDELTARKARWLRGGEAGRARLRVSEVVGDAELKHAAGADGGTVDARARLAEHAVARVAGSEHADADPARAPAIDRLRRRGRGPGCARLGKDLERPLEVRSVWRR